MAQSNIAQNTLLSNAVPALKLVHGKPRVSSVKIADHFNKRHVDVMRSIAQTIHNVPKEFAERNFALSDYTDSTGRKLRSYDLTRNGFMLVVMGYTGKEATFIKVGYINAFDAMEAELRKQSENPQPLALSTVDDRRPLVNLVNAWCKLANIPQPVAYTQVAGHFGLDRVTHLPTAWIQDAVNFVQARIDAAAGPKQIEATPTPSITQKSAIVGFWNGHHDTIHRAFIDLGHAMHDAATAMRFRLRTTPGESHGSAWAKYQLTMQLRAADDMVDAAQSAMLAAGQLASILEANGQLTPNI